MISGDVKIFIPDRSSVHEDGHLLKTVRFRGIRAYEGKWDGKPGGRLLLSIRPAVPDTGNFRRVNPFTIPSALDQDHDVPSLVDNR